MPRAPRTATVPTIRDVARLAGVSVATASRVVRGEQLVRPEKVEAVQAAVQTLGYIPNAAARGLVERRTGAIAMVFPEREGRVFSDPFFGSVVSGVSTVLHSTEQQLVLVMTGGDDSGEKLHRFVRGNHCDGIILASHHESEALAAALSTAVIPAVSIGAPIAGLSIPYVDLDNTEGGRLAARRLVEAGRRRLAVIGGPQDMPSANHRLAGFLEVAAEAGVEPPVVVHGDYSSGSGTEAIIRILDRAPQIDGLFVANDLMAHAALQQLRARGVRVPEDVAVVGFDNIDAQRAELAGLTTINNPVAAMAESAATLLLDTIAGADVKDHAIYSPTLVPRATG